MECAKNFAPKALLAGGLCGLCVATGKTSSKNSASCAWNYALGTRRWPAPWLCAKASRKPGSGRDRPAPHSILQVGVSGRSAVGLSRLENWPRRSKRTGTEFLLSFLIAYPPHPSKPSTVSFKPPAAEPAASETSPTSKPFPIGWLDASTYKYPPPLPTQFRSEEHTSELQ